MNFFTLTPLKSAYVGTDGGGGVHFEGEERGGKFINTYAQWCVPPRNGVFRVIISPVRFWIFTFGVIVGLTAFYHNNNHDSYAGAGSSLRPQSSRICSDSVYRHLAVADDCLPSILVICELFLRFELHW